MLGLGPRLHPGGVSRYAGLKRRCILDRDEQIAQKHAIVSIYSDETPESVEATRIMCDSTENEFIE